MGEREDDRQVLAALAAHGANLTKPAHIIHFLYFKSLQAANAAADELRIAGYKILRVEPALTKKSFIEAFTTSRKFSCIAETHSIPSESGVFATSDWMNAMAEKFDGGIRWMGIKHRKVA